MSVINRVLVDLEKRHAGGASAHRATSEIRAVGREPSGGVGRKALAVLLAVIACAAIAASAWQWQSNRRHEPETSQAAPVAPPLPPSAAPPVAPTPAPTLAAVTAQPAAVVPSVPPMPEPQNAPASPPPTSPAAITPDVALPARALPAQPSGKPVTAVASRPAPKSTPSATSVVVGASPTAPGAEAGPEAAIEKRDRPLSALERADAQFRQGVQAMQRGRATESEAAFLAALAEDATHVPSRQALIGLYLEAQRKDESEVLVRDGLRAGIRPPSWVMLLARLEADRGDVAGAVATLQTHLDVGRENGDYLSLLGTLLQKQGRHKEAVDQYQAAIALGAAKPTWFMGQGISLRELGRREEASAAFHRALEGEGMSAELKVFLERQIAALRTQRVN